MTPQQTPGVPLKASEQSPVPLQHAPQVPLAEMFAALGGFSAATTSASSPPFFSDVEVAEEESAVVTLVSERLPATLLLSELGELGVGAAQVECSRSSTSASDKGFGVMTTTRRIRICIVL